MPEKLRFHKPLLFMLKPVGCNSQKMKRRFLPNKGFEYNLDKRILILQLISMTKENSKLTNEDIEKFILITSNYIENIAQKDKLYKLFGEIDYINDTSIDNCGPFYKFIHKETYDNFISKGKFQLGSLEQYREIERTESRDEKEGFSNLIIDSGKRQILTSVISGFDQYILCGTYNLDLQDLMRKNFGGYILKIKNVKSFANKIQKAIGAIKWQIDKVKYTDYKAFRTSVNVKDLSGVSPELSDELFNILHQISERPSVFSKPTKFKDEQELRLTFSMSKKVKKKLNFDNLGLLSEIELIKTTANTS